MSSEKIDVLITDDLPEEGLNLLRQAPDIHLRYRPQISVSDLKAEICEADVLVVRTRIKVDDSLLAHAPLLKLVCRAGIGVDHFDLDALRKRGIAAMNTPEANRRAATEHTLGLILNLLHHATRADRDLRRGHWDRKGHTGMELAGRQLGIIGLGGIGTRVAALAQAFQMRVAAYDPYKPDSHFQEYKTARHTQLHGLVSQSDVVSLHCPLTAETKGLINYQALIHFRPGSFLVNTSRGAVVDEPALVDAIQNKKLAGAALDVFCEEPLNPASSLLKLDEVILTPHIAGQTQEALRQISIDVANQVLAFVREKKIIHSVL